MLLVELQNTCKKKLNWKKLERPNICYIFQSWVFPMHNDGLRNGRGRPSLRTSGRTKDRIAANQVSCKQPTTANESITTKQLTPHPRQARRQKAPPRDDKSLKIVSLCGKLLFAHLNLIFFNKRLPLIADPSVSCIFINHLPSGPRIISVYILGKNWLEWLDQMGF